MKLLLIQGCFSWPPLSVLPDGARLEQGFHGFLWGPLDGTFNQDDGSNCLPDRIKVNLLEDRFGLADVYDAHLDETAGTLRFTKVYHMDRRASIQHDLRRGSDCWFGTYTRSDNGGAGFVRCAVTLSDESFFVGVLQAQEGPGFEEG